MGINYESNKMPVVAPVFLCKNYYFLNFSVNLCGNHFPTGGCNLHAEKLSINKVVKAIWITMFIYWQPIRKMRAGM
jgi:hypothetical protein